MGGEVVVFIVAHNNKMTKILVSYALASC